MFSQSEWIKDASRQPQHKNAEIDSLSYRVRYRSHAKRFRINRCTGEFELSLFPLEL